MELATGKLLAAGRARLAPHLRQYNFATRYIGMCINEESRTHGSTEWLQQPSIGVGALRRNVHVLIEILAFFLLFSRLKVPLPIRKIIKE